MDLKAYLQIDSLEGLLKYNNIEVPRLRGIRWMKYENKISEIDKDFINDVEVESLRELISAVPFFDPNSFVFRCDDISEWNYNHHVIKVLNPKYKPDGYESEFIDLVDWSKIHGKYRKILKRVSKNTLNNAKKQFDIFNKYVGREDVICIHTRIGGANFKYYNGFNLIKNEWWLEKVDDYFDNTYCDIYAKIKVPEGFEKSYLKSSEDE